MLPLDAAVTTLLLDLPKRGALEASAMNYRADVDRLQLELRLDEQEQRPAEQRHDRRQDERERDEREVADDQIEAGSPYSMWSASRSS